MNRIHRSALGSSLNLRMDLIPQSNENRSGRPIAPTFITIHNTSNESVGADAAAHARFVKNKGFYLLSSGKRNYVSWHYTVDDMRIFKHLPVNERAIHAGKGNGKSIAIEICMNSGIDQVAANERAARLVAVLIHDLKIPIENIKTHKYWTGKACPTLLLANFISFRNRCEKIFNSITVDGEIFDSDALTQEEIDQVLTPPIEVEAEMLLEPEDDPENEHSAIAAEVDAYIE